MTLNDLSVSTTAQLLGVYARILAELRNRGVVRTGNPPAGDYGEWLVARALRGRLVKVPSVKSYGIVLNDGRTVQVKVRVVSDPPRAAQRTTSPFRSWEFDLAALVLLDSTDYRVVRAALLPSAVLSEVGRYSASANGWVVQMTPAVLGRSEARDITADLRRAADTVVAES